MTTTTQFPVGTLVRVAPEFAKTSAHRTSTYRVVKVNPKTLKLENTETKAALVADPAVLVPADSVPEGPAYMGSPLIGPAPDFEMFEKGTVVTFAQKPGYFVVTGESDRGYRIFPLGGSPRYFTGIPMRLLTRVTEISNWKA